MADFTLTKYEGNTFVLPVTVEDTNLTGATVEFQLNDYTLETDGVTLDPDPLDDSGQFTITVSAELMTALNKKYYLFEVTVTDTQGNKLTYFVGGLRLLERVIEDD